MSQGFPQAGTPAPLLPRGPPAKVFRNCFIIALDNFKFLVIWEKNGCLIWPRSEKSSTGLNLGQIKFSKLQVANIPRFFVQMVFFPRLFPPNQGHCGRNCAATKKISAACLDKVTNIAHFTPICRSRGPTISPTLCHLVPFMSRISEKCRAGTARHLL